PVEGQIEFRHRTFHDFLTARAIVKNVRIDSLLKEAVDEQWHDIIILATGVASLTEAERLLRGLLKLAQTEGLLRGLFERVSRSWAKQSGKYGESTQAEQRRYRLHALALACLETCVLLSPELRKEITQQAAVFFPPNDESE